MAITDFGSELDLRVRELVLSGFTPRFGKLAEHFGSNPLWKRMRELGTELWLDTGDIEAARALWTQEFAALTTNNTLLNKEVQKGTYDELIGQAAKLLDKFGELTDEQRKLEVAFILNARHGLRLVEEFDAFVSVEEHTGHQQRPGGGDALRPALLRRLPPALLRQDTALAGRGCWRRGAWRLRAYPSTTRSASRRGRTTWSHGSAGRRSSTSSWGGSTASWRTTDWAAAPTWASGRPWPPSAR